MSMTDADPLEEQREIYELLSQETRHLILQNILGHPQNLPSLDELDHMIRKNKASIADQLDILEEENIIQECDYEPNESSRDLPSKFYTFTQQGLEILEEHNYLRGLQFARTVYDNTRKTEKVERHEEAPRPDLPEAVVTILSENDTRRKADSEKLTDITRHVMEENSNTRSVKDQVSVAKLLYKENIVSPNEGATRKEIEELLGEEGIELDYSLNTCLDNLLDADVIERNKPPGPDVYVIGERIDEIINGRVEEYAEQEIESLIEHMDEEIERIQAIELTPEESGTGQTVAIADGAGNTIRQVLSQKFQKPAHEIEDYLREGDKIDKLNEAVQAIKEHDQLTKGKDYAEILFFNQSYQYRLTERFS
jgi:hypothetical protein